MHLTSKKSNVEALNRWYAECERRSIPYVTVLRRNKYAEVQWDCISLPTHLDDRMYSNAEEIEREVAELYRGHALRKSRRPWSAFAGTLENLDAEDAEGVAELIFEILNSRLVR